MLIKGGTIVNEGRSFLGDLLVDGEVISDIFEGMAPRGIYDEVVDATGCFVLPGVIDDHVHFREPGLTRKADIESESRAVALASAMPRGCLWRRDFLYGNAEYRAADY